MISVLLLLGGNLGSVEQTFMGVRGDLEREAGEILRSSEILRSAAWGFQADDFLNQAVELTTELGAEELLDVTQGIEERWGRDREAEAEAKRLGDERYCSRSIDIDIIFYGDAIIESERLTIPHPLMAEREFVLEPLVQIAPNFINPINRLSVEQMFNNLKLKS